MARHGCCAYFPQRYFKNRLKLQIAANYLGVVGSLFFALQNMSTNWGQSYLEDSALTDKVKVHACMRLPSLSTHTLSTHWLLTSHAMC